jgi:hypothetical protein
MKLWGDLGREWEYGTWDIGIPLVLDCNFDEKINWCTGYGFALLSMGRVRGSKNKVIYLLFSRGDFSSKSSYSIIMKLVKQLGIYTSLSQVSYPNK